MKRTLLALSLAASILAPAAALAASPSPEFFGLNLRHNLDGYERQAQTGRTMLEPDRVVYLGDTPCIGNVGYNRYVRCVGYSQLFEKVTLTAQPASVIQAKSQK